MPPRRQNRLERAKNKVTDARKKESDRLKSNATDTDKKALNVLQADLKRRAEEAESSQLSNHSPEQLEKPIDTNKEASKAMYLELQGHIKTVIDEINKLPQDLPKGELIKQQLTIIENSDLKNLMLTDIKNIKDEGKFLENEKNIIKNIRNEIAEYKEKFFDPLEKKFLSFFQVRGVDTDIDLKFPEQCHILNISNYYGTFKYKHGKPFLLANTLSKMYKEEKDFWKLPSVTEFDKIAMMNKAETVISSWDKLKTITLDQHTKFKNINFEDKIAVKNACEEIVRAYGQVDGQDKDRKFDALKILRDASFKQLRYLNKRDGENINKEKTLKESEEAWESTQSQAKLQEEKAQKFLQENANVEHGEEKLLGLCSLIKEDYKKFMFPILKSSVDFYHYDLVSFYDFVGKNLEYRLSNGLDELKKKCEEALHLFDEKIKEPELFHSQRPSELSKQPQKEMDQQSSAEKLQKYLETALKDADMTDQRRHIVDSYLSGLLEKSHLQSLDNATIDKFHRKHIKEAKQIGEYIEQKNFTNNKIQYDAIQLAIHLKHTFGFPIHDATIDQDFNIIQSDPPKDDSSSTPGLDIDHQGRILKGGRVQRVYLIGLQDPHEASSSHTQPKPRALLAIQSADTGYLKYGAGTPLPIGGVVDVVTAQHTTREQPNLYKATLAIETLQETHNQKEIDPQTLVVSPGSVGKPKMPLDKPASSGRSPSPLERETAQTLEIFETETVMRLKRSGESSSKTSSRGFEKIPLYDITTFVGKVKDRPHQPILDDFKKEQAYQETTGPCMVDLDELISTVKQELGLPDRFRPSQIVMKSLKRQIARQVLGEEKVPTSDQGWKTNGQTRWADFHEYSTSMNMFAKYLVLAYREDLGLAGSK